MSFSYSEVTTILIVSSNTTSDLHHHHESHPPTVEWVPVYATIVAYAVFVLYLILNKFGCFDGDVKPRNKVAVVHKKEVESLSPGDHDSTLRNKNLKQPYADENRNKASSENYHVIELPTPAAVSV